MTDTRIKPSITTIPDDLYIDDETTVDEQAYSSGDEMEECYKLLTDNVDDAILKYNVSKPLPLGGEPDWQTSLFYLKMKAVVLSVSLRELVLISSRLKRSASLTIAAMYGSSHLLVQRQRFYIDRFSSKGDRRAVQTHMRILSVVRIEVFSMYGYDYMKKIILRRANLKAYVIAERDFKYMYPSDFEELYLLNLQGHLNHLSPDDKKVHYCDQPLDKKLGYPTTRRRLSAGVNTITNLSKYGLHIWFIRSMNIAVNFRVDAGSLPTEIDKSSILVRDNDSFTIGAPTERTGLIKPLSE
ncbi:hypothetical protein Tco_0611638 [Tanacetum coccineum]